MSYSFIVPSENATARIFGASMPPNAVPATVASICLLKAFHSAIVRGRHANARGNGGSLNLDGLVNKSNGVLPTGPERSELVTSHTKIECPAVSATYLRRRARCKSMLNPRTSFFCTSYTGEATGWTCLVTYRPVLSHETNRTFLPGSPPAGHAT